MQDYNGDNDKDKKNGSKRVYKNEADRKRQKAMEGKDTPFQNALRAAEKAGKKTFTYNGKLYAAGSPSTKASTPSLDKMKSKGPGIEVDKPKLGAPKKVSVGKTDPKLAKDITGKPLFEKRRKSAAKGVARRLKKRQRQRRRNN